MDASTQDRFEILHSAVPGRLRISVPHVKNDDGFAAKLSGSLRAQAAIRDVRASVTTGNVTITYDPLLDTDVVLGLVSLASHAGSALSDNRPAETWWAKSTESVLR